MQLTQTTDLEDGNGQNYALHSPMVWLDEVVQGLALPQLGLCFQRLTLLQFIDGNGISRVLIDGECFAVRIATPSWGLRVIEK